MSATWCQVQKIVSAWCGFNQHNWHSFVSFEAIETSQIDQQQKHPGENVSPRRKEHKKAYRWPAKALSQNQMIMQIISGSFLKLCTEWQTKMLCLRTLEALGYISLYENTKVFLEYPTLFLCLPIHAPKCHGILTVTSFSQCHLLPEHPPTNC